MSLDVHSLRNSFELVVERNPQITKRFYEILFERYPQVIPLFNPQRRAAQEQMLTSALVAVIDHLDDAPWLAATLGSLGKKHVGYGVTREMYDWVGDALLCALAETAGEAWTEAVERAWTEAYGAITGLMCPEDAAATAA